MKDPIINENSTKVLPEEIIVEYDKTKTSSVNDHKIENNSISPKKKVTPGTRWFMHHRERFSSKNDEIEPKKLPT